MAVTHTNRKGVTYYLHQRERRGKTRFVFCRDLGDGQIEELPAGYAVNETPNGQVSLTRSKLPAITAGEEAAVRRFLPEHCKLELRAKTLIVHEPMGGGGAGMRRANPWLRAAIAEQLERNARYQPVMRLELVDEEERRFEVTRWRFSGHEGWSYPLGSGSLAEVARRFVPKVATQEYFALM